MTTKITKQQLAIAGKARVIQFCNLNGLDLPEFKNRIYGIGTCGWYHERIIAVQTEYCANLGYGGPAWSWPGYIIDRTPYGVYAHELGHYVDDVLGKGFKLSRDLRKQTKEEKISNYCPNTQEWFAEIFRLFMTNPNLLSLIRPLTYSAILERGIKPVETRPWRVVLGNCPARTYDMAKRRVEESQRNNVEQLEFFS